MTVQEMLSNTDDDRAVLESYGGPNSAARRKAEPETNPSRLRSMFSRPRSCPGTGATIEREL